MSIMSQVTLDMKLRKGIPSYPITHAIPSYHRSWIGLNVEGLIIIWATYYIESLD